MLFQGSEERDNELKALVRSDKRSLFSLASVLRVAGGSGVETVILRDYLLDFKELPLEEPKKVSSTRNERRKRDQDRYDHRTISSTITRK